MEEQKIEVYCHRIIMWSDYDITGMQNMMAQ